MNCSVFRILLGKYTRNYQYNMCFHFTALNQSLPRDKHPLDSRTRK